MPASRAHILATRKYNEKAYDRIEIKVPKGDKEYIRKYAVSKGESINGFINRAINETILRDYA